MKDFHILTKFKATTFATTGLIGVYFNTWNKILLSYKNWLIANLFFVWYNLRINSISICYCFQPLSDTSTTEKIDMTYITKPKFTRRHGFSKQHVIKLIQIRIIGEEKNGL